MRSTRPALLITITLAASLLSGLAWAQEETENSIQAQPLTRALAEFAEQTGMQLVYPSELTAGVDSNGASTEGTPDEILDQLLTSTGLEYEYVNDRTIAIAASVVIGVEDEGGASDSKKLSPVPTIVAQNTRSKTQTTVSSQSDDDVTEAQEDDSLVPLEEIVVTGTNIRGVDNPTVPVLTFDREDIALSGATTVDDFLRTIPQNFASETQLTSDSSNQNTGESGRGDFTQGTSVNLRGLGAGSTLTLLNGRRMVASGLLSSVDVNILPLGVIDRVDVLTDSATAIYGSDAVGGVVNFVTRKDYEGFEVSARYGTVTEGSREDFGVNAAGGLNWGSGGVFAGVDYQEQTPLLVEERDFIDLSETREGATLGSDADLLSIAGGFNQDLSSKARFGIDFLYSDRSSESFRITGTFPQESVSDQKAHYVNARIEYDATDAINLSLFLDYGLNEIVGTGTRFGTTATIKSRNEFTNELFVYEGRLSGELLSLPAGSIAFSVGGIFREERYDRASPTAGGFFDASARRDVFAGYAEVLIPVVGDNNAVPFVQKFSLSLASRYEDHSDVGDSFDPKIGAYWELNDEFSVRASYTQAFRVPDLDSLNQQDTFFLVPLPSAFFTAVTPPTSPTVNTLISQSDASVLGSENADSWSAGFTYNPSFARGLSITGNFFDIQYEDRLEFIGITQPLQDPAFGSLLDIDPDPSTVQSILDLGADGLAVVSNPANLSANDVRAFLRQGLQNIAERDVRGIDLGFSFTADTDVGKLTAGANSSFMIDYISRLAPTTDSSEQVDTLYNPVDFRLNGNLSWSNDGFTVATSINYTDGYRDDIDEPSASNIDSWTTVNFSFAYNTGDRFGSAVVDGTRIGFNVTNIFDRDPPSVSTIDGLNFDTANANPFGRQISFTISKVF